MPLLEVAHSLRSNLFGDACQISVKLDSLFLPQDGGYILHRVLKIWKYDQR